MARGNPTGYPLSGGDYDAGDGRFEVTYRPRYPGQKKRPRVYVPAEVAEQLRRSQSDEVGERHRLADVEPRPRKKRAKKAAKKRAKRTPPATTKRTTKKRAKRATTKPYQPAHKVPPEVMAQIVADVGKHLGGQLVPVKAKKAAARKVASAARAVARVADDAASGPLQTELFKNPRRRGAPNLAQLGACAELGQVLELIVELNDGGQEKHRWRANRPTLLWSPKQKCLLWVHGRRPAQRRKGATRKDGAAKSFERWSQREAKATASLMVPSKPLASLGRAVQIVYKSNKWGTVATYEHDFSNGARAYNAGQVFAVRGGALTVTERGIVY